LTCVNAADGRQIWNSQDASDLSSFNLLGRPLIVDNIAYMTAAPIMGRSTEITLLAISLKDGSVLWKMELGSAGAGVNYRGILFPTKPVLALRDQTLYVLIGNGALLAVNLAARRLDWAFTYDAPAAWSGPLSTVTSYAPDQGYFGSSLQLC